MSSVCLAATRRLVQALIFGFAMVVTALAARAQAPAIISVATPRQVVLKGRDLTLSISTVGATSFQWKRNGLPISGATNASYTITGAEPLRDNGYYQTVVSDGSGSAASSPVFVLVSYATSQMLSWGFTVFGLPPSTTIDAVGIAGGSSKGLALKADGTVVAWGGISPPAELGNVVAVALGDRHALALKADATVVAWGLNDYGQSTVPAGLSGVVAIAAGYGHSLALKAMARWWPGVAAHMAPRVRLFLPGWPT